MPKIKEKRGGTNLWKSLWKVWITICKKELSKTLCKSVEQRCEREKSGGKSVGRGQYDEFCRFLNEKSGRQNRAEKVCGALARKMLMQESGHDYRSYYSFFWSIRKREKRKHEKEQKLRTSFLTSAGKCAKIHFVFEKSTIQYAGVAQSVEQLIRNQQVMCSSHTTSSRKRLKS